MTKAPKKPDSRAKALAAMTKPELVKTIKALDRRQTQLLNQLQFEKDKLEASQLAAAGYLRILQDNGLTASPTEAADNCACGGGALSGHAGGCPESDVIEQDHTTPPPPSFPWS